MAVCGGDDEDDDMSLLQENITTITPPFLTYLPDSLLDNINVIDVQLVLQHQHPAR